ncbi:serine/threonine-protein kinase [Azospira restricta]|uniref:non-specific serine/threonine protein kinase n=1 Tax=Azospira restricta TaxID=404405 RepID=A0A974Y4G5_9RHOO|nr:serine/threonine-protein kinase [Azospira restricta]QRJ64416.1 serine/threonine protein kinase [Azospira restricta]
MSLSRLGRYEITGTLGRGAMGVVYRARDPLIERTVALKTVACGTLSASDAEEFEQRFFREAKSAGRLNHPNIVTIHDVGRDGELAWIAMEFLSGRSLRDRLDTGVPLSCERIVEIAAAVADGLAFAHAQGVVHRDVKPANIMVLDNGTVKLTDFGIAQIPGGGLTMAGAVLGSPKYMSPEQVAGQKADGRSDIFSLGTVLYELLTGQPPFSGDNLHATMYQVVHKAPPPPSGCCAGLPPVFDAIVAKAMAKEPAERYQDAAELAADLRRALGAVTPTLSGEAAGIATPSPAATMPAPLWRRPVAVAAGLALLAGAAVMALRPAPSAAPTPTPVAAPAAQAAAEPVPPPHVDKRPVDARPAERKPVRDLPPAKPARPAAAGDWLAALRADLKACDAQPVFRRIVCSERARWRHCPGHWGTVEECPATAAENRPAP